MCVRHWIGWPNGWWFQLETKTTTRSFQSQTDWLNEYKKIADLHVSKYFSLALKKPKMFTLQLNNTKIKYIDGELTRSCYVGCIFIVCVISLG